MWTVPNTQQLNGIVAAPDGTLGSQTARATPFPQLQPQHSAATASSSAAPAGVGVSCVYVVIDSRGSGERDGTVSPPGAAFAAALQRRHPTRARRRVLESVPAVGLWGSVRQVLNLIGAGLGIGPLGAYHASVVPTAELAARQHREQDHGLPAREALP